LVRDSGDRLTTAAVAGVALIYFATHIGHNTQFAQLPSASLREIFGNKSLPAAPRLGAALALTYNSEDRRNVLERLSDPNEERELRALFCSACLMQPVDRAWLWSMSFGKNEVVKELADFLVDRSLDDPDAEVRRESAKALSASGRGQSKLL